MTHTIKITYHDGDTVTTKINGTKEEVINAYRNNNFFVWCSSESIDKQAVQLQFIESPLLIEGCTHIIYQFVDFDNNGLKQ